MADIPHLSFPAKLHGTRFATVEQDSIEDVSQCVQVILSTPVGARLDLPEFGAPDQTFAQQGVDPEALEPAVVEWEPRVLLEFVPDEDKNLQGGEDRLTVRVRLAEEEV